MRRNTAFQPPAMPAPAFGSDQLWHVLAACQRVNDSTILPVADQVLPARAAAAQLYIPERMARAIVHGYLGCFVIGHTTMLLPDLQRVPLLQALTAAQQEATKVNTHARS